MSKDLGERLARLEAEQECLQAEREDMQRQLDRRLTEAERLHDSQLDGLSQKLQAVGEAQDRAATKAEQATSRQISLLGEQSERRAEEMYRRLGALESGEAGRKGASELKASTVGLLSALAAVGLVLLYFLHP